MHSPKALIIWHLSKSIRWRRSRKLLGSDWQRRGWDSWEAIALLHHQPGRAEINFGEAEAVVEAGYRHRIPNRPVPS